MSLEKVLIIFRQRKSLRSHSVRLSVYMTSFEKAKFIVSHHHTQTDPSYSVAEGIDCFDWLGLRIVLGTSRQFRIVQQLRSLIHPLSSRYSWRARSRVSFCQKGRLNNRIVEFVVKNGEAVLLQHCENIRFDILKHLMKLEKETLWNAIEVSNMWNAYAPAFVPGQAWGAHSGFFFKVLIQSASARMKRIPG